MKDPVKEIFDFWAKIDAREKPATVRKGMGR